MGGNYIKKSASATSFKDPLYQRAKNFIISFNKKIHITRLPSQIRFLFLLSLAHYPYPCNAATCCMSLWRLNGEAQLRHLWWEKLLENTASPKSSHYSTFLSRLKCCFLWLRLRTSSSTQIYGIRKAPTSLVGTLNNRGLHLTIGDLGGLDETHYRNTWSLNTD